MRILSPLKYRRRLRKNVDVLSNSVFFNKEYYIEKNKLSTKIRAAQHFCSVGWKRGYNPSRFFDTNFYLARYEDVRSKEINPLIHYLTDGAKEKRTPSHAFDIHAFCEVHRDRIPSDANPAELCIAWYGSYDWQEGRSSPIHIPPEASAAFKAIFDEKFYVSMNPDILNLGMDPYQHFILQGQYEDRDPSPTFNIYKYKRNISENLPPVSNPIIHYVEIGSGLHWPLQEASELLLEPKSSDLDRSFIGSSAHPTVCVHAHCFYPELISELIPRFLSLPDETDLIVTVISEADKQFVQQVFAREHYVGRYEVRVVPNRGRDLGPFIVGCRDIWWKYDLVLHVHTKRSPHVKWGDHWRRYLLDQTMGSPEIVQAVIQRFREESDLGCLYPRNFHMIRRFLRQDANTDVIDRVIASLGYESTAWRGIDYPAGSMAWYRTEPLRALVEMYGRIEAFDTENDQQDTTFAHVLERVLPIATRAAGSRVASYVTSRRISPVDLKALPHREDSRSPVVKRWYRDTPRIAQNPLRMLNPVSRSYDANALDIHWIVPSFGRGAGGHMTIFRIIAYLEKFGHYQTIWLQNALSFEDQSAAKKAIREWYQPIGDRVHIRFLPEDVREIAGDVLIATDCWTAFPASETLNFKERFYFVQDYESSFHPWGELQLMAEATYDFGFPTLCAGRWLHGLMAARGLWARPWDLCADHDVYFPGVPRSTGSVPVQIVFYARAYTPRRAVTLGFAALEELHRRGANFHVDLFGEENLTVDFTFPHTQHGILKPAELSELYRSADVGLVFSTTNYSLIPLEMMACDLPVVEVDTPSTRAIFTDGEVAFAKPVPYAIADTIEALINDPARREKQRQQARRFVSGTSWENSARLIEAALQDRLAEQGFSSIAPVSIMAPSLIKGRTATVFIPTYNAGPAFADVLDIVTRQVCDFAYDVLVIDSESSDGTPDLARHYAKQGVRVESIAKASFQHGRTRNLGIKWSDGAFVAMLTQDARPADEHWLKHLISGFSRGPRVAGVIGRHKAYPDHDLFTRRDMTEMFNGLALLPPVIDREIGLPSYIYPGGRTWRMLRQFYSDNNSAMSRQAWEVLPYPEIDWGEDQVWADEMLRIGFQKAYVNEAIVYHSHAFDLAQQYKTALTEGEFWGHHFGFNLHFDPKAEIAAMDMRDQEFALHHGISDQILVRRKHFNRATVEGRVSGYKKSRLDLVR